MLVLTRHCGEQIVIAEEIVVTVVAIEGNKIRIGVEAPKSVRVDRQEVHERRQADKARLAPLTSPVIAATMPQVIAGS